MQYMLMCCFNEAQWEKIPAAQRDGIMHDYETVVRDLIESGHYVGGAKLRPSSSATTVREKNGRPAITDGPFAETKEQLGGYHVIECADVDEAISIAQRIPTIAFGGTVEVRAVEDAKA
jgi:hypothetical protein